ncbi:MAG: hypothetical protein ABL876_06335 [Chitinophagaceae bacterium]
MKKLLFHLSLFVAFVPVYSQTGVPKPLKATIKLLMPRTADDDMPGTRGASVVWHPVQKKYYAAMAGNVGYPLGVYDATGKLLSTDDLSTEQDIRGLWYNPVKKQIQGNTYNDYGWFYYTLNAKGIPLSSTVFAEGMNQPDEQSVGAFSISKQQVMFLKAGQVFTYSSTGESIGDPLTIHWGRSKADGVSDTEPEEPATPEDYNYTTVVFTGIKGSELGFLNITEMQIELYSIEDGFMTRALKLPEDAPLNQSFNFSYANGMYWLFSIEERIWTSYK